MTREYQDILIGPAGYTLIEFAKKHRSRMAMIRIAELVEQAMVKQGLTKDDMVKYLKTDHENLTEILNGSKDLTLSEIIRLEEVLYIDLISNSLYGSDEVKKEYGVHYPDKDGNF